MGRYLHRRQPIRGLVYGAMAVETYPDGSWIDRDPLLGDTRWCLSEQVIQDEFPEWQHNYLRKWNCVDTDGVYENTLRLGEQQLDILSSFLGPLIGTEPTAFRDEVDPESPYWTDPADVVVTELQNWLYKVFHAGYSLVFGVPLMGILTALNKKRSSGDPTYRNQINFRQALFNPLGDDVKEIIYSSELVEYDPVSHTTDLEYVDASYDPVDYLRLELEVFQEYDPI